MLFNPARYLAAFEPGYRLKVCPRFASVWRSLLLNWSREMLYGYDVPVEEFFERIRGYGRRFEPIVAQQRDSNLIQQKFNEIGGDYDELTRL